MHDSVFRAAARRLVPVVLLLCACAAPSPAETPTLSAAEASFSQGKFDQARKTYTALVKADPKSTAPYPGLIQSLLRLDQWRDALRAAQAGVALDPSSADLRGLLAMTEIRAGEPEAAEVDADKALAVEKTNYWGLVAAGRVAAWDGHQKAGLALFTQATALHPERPDAWLGEWQATEDPGVTEATLQIASHYLALAPKGQPFDFETPFIANLVQNETGYWRRFSSDPPFHLDKPDGKDGKPEAYTAVFPIQRDGDSVLVSVGINGKTFHLLFDTGADSLLLSKTAAKRLALADLAKSYVAGVQGKAPAVLQRADTLTLGSVTMHSIPITVSDTGPDKTDGIFGGTLLDDYAVTLDFVNSVMIIARGPGSGHIPLPHTSTATAPLHVFHEHLFVATHTENRRIWAMLDTGAYTDLFSLDLTHDLSKRTNRDDWKEGTFEERVGIGDSAMQIDYCVTPAKLTFAFDGSSPPATLTQDGLIGQSAIDHQLSPSFDFEIGMILGVPLLSQHSRVTIDYPHHLLTFEDPLP